MGQPGAQFCAPPSMLSNPNSQMCSFGTGAMCSVGAGAVVHSPGPMSAGPSAHMLGGMHGPPGTSIGPAGIHGTTSQFSMHHSSPSQQPFQQLSHFVNNDVSKWHSWKFERSTRDSLAGHLWIDGYTGEKDLLQGPTAIEPPPPFSQAISNQYSAMQASSVMYSQSAHMMRPSSAMQQQQGQNPNMMTGPRTPQSVMMAMHHHPSLGSPSNPALFGRYARFCLTNQPTCSVSVP
ncbi:unnamed protein product [Gongylonema pulchrum]|uniref:NOT2_3_5 domain-containing protein n=1 Tax=Gongylonema pulchrum TaxID=637853 RepID=A0A183EK29_9BILA|nr:unnamed protein product [Gongylonema pulchrum]